MPSLGDMPIEIVQRIADHLSDRNLTGYGHEHACRFARVAKRYLDPSRRSMVRTISIYAVLSKSETELLRFLEQHPTYYAAIYGLFVDLRRAAGWKDGPLIIAFVKSCSSLTRLDVITEGGKSWLDFQDAIGLEHHALPIRSLRVRADRSEFAECILTLLRRSAQTIVDINYTGADAGQADPEVTALPAMPNLRVIKVEGWHRGSVATPNLINALAAAATSKDLRLEATKLSAPGALDARRKTASIRLLDYTPSTLLAAFTNLRELAIPISDPTADMECSLLPRTLKHLEAKLGMGDSDGNRIPADGLRLASQLSDTRILPMLTSLTVKYRKPYYNRDWTGCDSAVRSIGEVCSSRGIALKFEID